jgi:hypothetical protein
MLELDFWHRSRSPLPPELRGRMRWVAAHANRCRYSEAYAAADLRRAGVDEGRLRELAGDFPGLPADTRAALAFAQKLTQAPDTITDEEVTRLIGLYGEKQVVAMAMLLAYANFQDRLILALDVPLESGGPVPPLDVHFKEARPGVRREAPPLPEAPRWAPKAAAARVAGRMADADWLALDYGKLRQEMDKQKARQPRIKLPDAGEGAVRWGLVCRAYQPELTDAWAACARAFGNEAEQDPVFEGTLFWVVARSSRCFY